MSTSTLPCPLLTDLPLDALELVLRALTSKTILRLHYTGNKRLQLLLKECPVRFYFPGTSAPMGVLPLVCQFSKLRSLQLHPWAREAESWHFSVHTLKALPATVQELEIPFRISEEHIKALPAGLLNLTLYGQVHTLTSAAKYLPRTLQSFAASQLKAPKLLFFQGLPKGLVSLFIGGKDCLTDEDLPVLPPNLTHLSLGENTAITDAGITKLPQHMTELSLFRNRLLTSACAPLLPRHLTSLSLPLSLVSTAALPHLPPDLIHLNLSTEFYEELTDEDVPLLPRGLRSMDLSRNSNLTAACIPHLPPRMRSGNRGGLPSPLLAALAREFVAALPPETPVLRVPHWVQRWVNESMIPYLPRGLTNITWAQDNVSDAGLKSGLPPALTLLRLSGAAISDAALSSLPQHLTLLSLPKCTQITDEGLADLPRSLRSLCLDLNRNISDAGIPHLPPQLSELYLQTNNKLTDEAIPLLPRTLTILDLSWNKLLTDTAIPNLPPALTELQLNSCSKLTDACCKHFPKTLKRLGLTDARKITSAGATHLAFIVYTSLPSTY